jgi:hypothetical protein
VLQMCDTNSCRAWWSGGSDDVGCGTCRFCELGKLRFECRWVQATALWADARGMGEDGHGAVGW